MPHDCTGRMTPGREDEEQAYNPRLSVPEAGAILGSWPAQAEMARGRYRPMSELRYGQHPRETLDLFRAREPRGTVIFIHGGYWRAFSKDEFSWVAEGFVDRGLSVVLLNYPLCPEVRLTRIVEATRRAFAHLHRDVLLPAERRRIAVTGHSAGGYLSALHLATDWREYGLPRDPIAGVVSVSGIFALAPLIPTSMNEALRLDPVSAAALSLDTQPWRSRGKAVFAVGADETAAFHRQSDAMAASWRDLEPEVIEVARRNHFDVIDDLARPGSRLNDAVLDVLSVGR